MTEFSRGQAQGEARARSTVVVCLKSHRPRQRHGVFSSRGRGRKETGRPGDGFDLVHDPSLAAPMARSTDGVMLEIRGLRRVSPKLATPDPRLNAVARSAGFFDATTGSSSGRIDRRATDLGGTNTFPPGFFSSPAVMGGKCVRVARATRGSFAVASMRKSSPTKNLSLLAQHGDFPSIVHEDSASVGGEVSVLPCS